METMVVVFKEASCRVAGLFCRESILLSTDASVFKRKGSLKGAVLHRFCCRFSPEVPAS